MTRQRRAAGSLAMVGIFAMTMVPSAQAAFAPGASQDAINLIIRMQAQAAMAAQRAVVDYYAKTYENENGPFQTYEAAVNNGLLALWTESHGLNGVSDHEFGTMFYRDEFGKFWYSTPKMGTSWPAGGGAATAPFTTADIKRPNTTLVGTAHSHPDPMTIPTGLVEQWPTAAGDNSTGYEQWVMRWDGDIWYLPPYSHDPKAYGGVREGSTYVTTRYTAGGITQLRNPNVDLYRVKAVNTPNGTSFWKYVLIGAAIVTVVPIVIIIIVMGDNSSGGGGTGTCHSGDASCADQGY